MEGGEGGEEGEETKHSNRTFAHCSKKQKECKICFFYRSGRFLSIAGIKQALLDDVPSSSDESRGTTDSDDEPSDVEDLDYKKERQGQRRAAHR